MGGASWLARSGTGRGSCGEAWVWPSVDRTVATVDVREGTSTTKKEAPHSTLHSLHASTLYYEKMQRLIVMDQRLMRNLDKRACWIQAASSPLSSLNGPLLCQLCPWRSHPGGSMRRSKRE